MSTGVLKPEPERDPQESMSLAETLNEAYEAQGKILREKILFGLTIYPALSPSMLHVFLGTATPKALWKDLVLNSLIEEGVVEKTEVTLTSPHDRTQTYTILHLTDKPYNKPDMSACISDTEEVVTSTDS